MILDERLGKRCAIPRLNRRRNGTINNYWEFSHMKESFKTIAVLTILSIIAIIVLEVVWGIR